MNKNVASQKLTVFAFDATTNLPKTGDAANLTAYVSQNDGTVTILGDTSATEMDATNAKGYYIFDLAQAETNANKLTFTGKSSTSNIVVIAIPQVCYTDPANYTALVIDTSGLADANTVKIGPTGSGTPQTARDVGLALPAAAAGAAGGLIIIGTNNTTAIVLGAVTLGALAMTTLTASGAVAFQSTFAVTGTTTLTGAVSLGSTLGITGGVTLSSTLSVGNTTLNALTVTNNLLVSGTSTLTGNVTLSGTLGVGNTTLNALTITTNLLVSGTTTHTGNVSFGAAFGVTGTTTLNALTITNNLGVGGTFVVTGQTTLTLAAATLGAIAAATRDVNNQTPAVNSLGAAVNSAGSGADPLDNPVPGSYASGTAGNILGNIGAVVDTTLTAQHGAGAWGSGSGSGAFTIEVTVTDGTDPLENAVVQVSDGITPITQTTDVDGHASYSLNAATYEVSIVKAGYAFTPEDRTVTGNQAGTLVNDLEMTLVVIPSPPTNPLKGTIYGGIVRSGTGSLLGVTIEAVIGNPEGRIIPYLVQADGNLLIPDPVTTQTLSDGSWSMDLFGNDLIVPVGSLWTVNVQGSNFNRKIAVVHGQVQYVNALIT